MGINQKKMPPIGWFLLILLIGCMIVMVYEHKRLESRTQYYDFTSGRLLEQKIRFSMDSAEFEVRMGASKRREDSLIKLSKSSEIRYEEKIIYIFDSIPDADIDRLFAVTMDSLARTRFKRFTEKTDSAGSRRNNDHARLFHKKS